MTTQQIFNKVWKYFIVDKNPLGNEDGSCRLRTKSGYKCAIGCLIPNRDYRKGMDEVNTIEQAIKFYPVLKKLLPVDIEEYNYQVNFLRKLQVAHDNSNNIFPINVRLKQFAEERDLKIP
ncbi:MAG: hypothetical protein AABY07_00920 [Nanoarchaeota archaeon]